MAESSHCEHVLLVLMKALGLPKNDLLVSEQHQLWISRGPRNFTSELRRVDALNKVKIEQGKRDLVPGGVQLSEGKGIIPGDLGGENPSTTITHALEKSLATKVIS